MLQRFKNSNNAPAPSPYPNAVMATTTAHNLISTYEVLQCPPTATKSEPKKAYVSLIGLSEDEASKQNKQFSVAHLIGQFASRSIHRRCGEISSGFVYFVFI
jgi:hypothetical protein